MLNKFLEKIAEQTDKEHALLVGLVGPFAFTNKNFRKNENLKGSVKTMERSLLQGTAGHFLGGSAGYYAGRKISPRASVIGAALGSIGGGMIGSYSGALSSVRNRIRNGTLKGVIDTSKHDE